jgi:hypothetical protein
MALDLNNDWVRKDSAAAPNTYYGYTLTPNAPEDAAVYAIRRVNSTASVDKVLWTNGNPESFSSNWTWRQASFVAPTSFSLATYSTFQDATYRNAQVSWSLVKGVDVYLVTVRTEGGSLLSLDGLPLQGPNVTRNYTINLINETSVTAAFLSSGTYSITITAQNVAGSISSTATFSFT